MFELRKHLEHTRKYADAFWKHEMLDRPYVSVRAPIQPSDFSFTPAESFRTCMSGAYDSALQGMLAHVEKTYYGGEALPVLELTLGPDQYAGFLGAKIETNRETFTTWSVPCVEDWADFTVAIDRSETGYFHKLREFFVYAAEFCRDKFLLNTLDLHSNLDALSALRGPMDLCYDLMDCPEDVSRVLDEVRKTYEEVYNLAYEGGNMKEIGTLGWIPAYCEGRSAVLQCDFSCMISPEQGRRFVFPAIQEEAASHEHCIYHLDGKDALVHLDTILAIPEIDCIEWVPGAGAPKSYDWMDLLKKIQAAGKSVWVDDWTVEDVKRYHRELQPDKVGYLLWASDPGEAEGILEYLVKNT